MDLTRAAFCDPYEIVDWPESVGDDAQCLPDRLISIVDTGAFDALDRAGRRRLSLFECANLFSVLLHGEKAYVAGLAARIHEPATASHAEYLHALIDEENKHMYLFSQFCTRYAGGVYPDHGFPFPADGPKEETDLVFYAQALLMEEMFDHLNRAVVGDPSIDSTVRRIHQIHIDDEARHISFGRAHLEDLVERLAQTAGAGRLLAIGAYLDRYMTVMLERLANPRVYQDAGLDDAYALRRQALASEGVRSLHAAATVRSRGFLTKLGLVGPEQAA